MIKWKQQTWENLRRRSTAAESFCVVYETSYVTVVLIQFLS